MSTQTPPIRQHIVPRFYLDGFIDPTMSEGGQSLLWVYRRGMEPFKQTPANAAIVKNFYTFEHSGEKQYTLEEALGKVESDAAPILNRIQTDGLRLTAQDRAAFASFIAVSAFRVPAFYAGTNRIAEIIHEKGLEKMGEDTDWLLSSIESDGLEITPEQVVEFVEAVKTGEIEVRQRSHGWVLQKMFDAMTELTPYIEAMNWSLLETTAEVPFITTDVPVSLVEPSIPRPWNQGLEISHKAYFFFPLDRLRCLCGSYEALDSMAKCRPFDVRWLNKRAILSAHENVFASERATPLMRIVDRFLGEGLQRRMERLHQVVQLPAWTTNG